MDSYLRIDDDGKIIDFITGTALENRPEERVRQKFIKILMEEYGYNKNQMAREVGIFYGCSEMSDSDGNPVRADIVVYENAIACRGRDQGKILFIVECKAPNHTEGYKQLVSYIYNTSASGGVWYNGDGSEFEVAYFRRLHEPDNKLIEWPGLPRKNEQWDIFGRRKKSELKPIKDVKALFHLCHNKLHARGSEEDDLTMEMVRIILAKARDEEREGETPQFYCTPEEYNSETGRTITDRINSLFDEVKIDNNEIFTSEERIMIGERALKDVVTVLQDFQLLQDSTDSVEWDLMGAAYEEYTATYLKRQAGQFFTNRLVINFMVQMLAPTPDDIILDPAGGSGGFLTGSLRYVRERILSSTATDIVKRRRLDSFKNRMFMVETSKRLVKVARTAMILNGDGYTGMTQGDSLGAYSNFAERIVSMCKRGTPSIILTNPPFAGVGEGKISDKRTLERFDVGKKWAYIDGDYQKTDELCSDGVPPEMLFVERCIDWLKPGGKLGIVLPKGFLDTNTYQPARAYMLKNCRLLAVLNMHKNTFQPYTGVRTCLVFVQKFSENDSYDTISDYPVFMAISNKIGQDSEGVPIYQYDDSGEKTEKIDQDLDLILSKYQSFTESDLSNSEYCFSIMRSDIENDYRFNPQAFMPSLNETLRAVANIDNIDGWSVTTIGQLVPDIQIFKGPRLRTDNINVSGPNDGAQVEPYFTPSAILQEKADSVKYLDLSRATKKQLHDFAIVRLKRGDIVITRSGSIGRASMITQQFDKVIASDDLIRVRINDEYLRHYVYCYLQCKEAVDQMMRNEYGSIQQHLEPAHVSNLLIPVPDDMALLQPIIDASKAAFTSKEESYNSLQQGIGAVRSLMDTVK
ncbi:N-6 DNA methylase [Eubacterium sp. AB3007]|uniref:N-6 DNA methylase n=1 Tax=Eubacterium sp. AB3007 TaxID=1392487 RepID=UPI00048729EA|nr:N-6 DNA methylase [Eubacterium sp. AB3007]